MRPATRLTRFTPLLAPLLALLISGCAPRAALPTPTLDRDVEGRAPTLLSAFFGLDDALPPPADFRLCLGASGRDGLPLVFSHQIDATSLQREDFLVLSASGAAHTPACVTFQPAAEAGERRTLLLIGEFGDAGDDPPALVQVVGDLFSAGAPGGLLNFLGAGAEVTPLTHGPSLVWAESVSGEQWDLGMAGGPWGVGSGCPVGVVQVVRATWSGGVTKPGGAEVDALETALYRVVLEQETGALIEVAPFALGDLGDGDNNHELCLDVAGTPREVRFPAGQLTDPNDDLNLDSNVAVSRISR